MILRKILLSVFCVVLVIGSVGAKNKNGNQLNKIIATDSLYQIPKTNVAPIIDGVQDPIWKTLDWNFQRIYGSGGSIMPDGGTDLTGMSKAMYDDTNLYILFYSQDDDMEDNPGAANWNKDAVEIYIDGDNSKIPDGVAPDPGGGLAPGDVQMTMPHAIMDHEIGSISYTGWPAAMDSTGIEFKLREDDNAAGLGGWWTEIKIPLDNLDIQPLANTLIGFELQQDESDASDNGARGSMSKWWNTSNNSWTDASIWGTAILSDRVVDTTAGVEILKVPAGTTITIDGVMDPIYASANTVTLNEYRVGDPPSVTQPENIMTDALTTAYLLYDDTNFYAFFDVIDDDIQDNPGAANWNKDAVEFYIDADNSKIPDGVAPDPGGGLAPGDVQITIPHAIMDHEVGSVGYTGWPASLDSTGVEFKITEKSEGGWYCELKIPLDNIDLQPLEGTVIGLELQQDESDVADAGARGSMEKWWSPSNNSWTNAAIWGTAHLGGVATAVGVREKAGKVVTNYSLTQNYPNPFNPTTKIEFSIPEAGLVSLKVYNLLGQEVATLVNKEMSSGNFVADFKANNLPSGVYVYKLKAGNTSLVRKMMLLK